MDARDEFDPRMSYQMNRLPTDRPLSVYVLIAVIVVIWLATELTGGTNDMENMVRWGANFSPFVTSGEFWRLLSANWLHFGVQHLALNAYSLYALGSQVESLFGRRRFLAIYLLSGVSGAVMSYWLTAGLSAGASTSIFGMFGAMLVYYYRQREVIGSESQAQLRRMLVLLAINVVFGLLPGTRIDNWGHAGGLLGGVALAWFLCPRYVRTDGLMRRDVELTTPYIADENTLGRNWAVLALFVAVLAAFTVALAAARSGG